MTFMRRSIPTFRDSKPTVWVLLGVTFVLGLSLFILTDTICVSQLIFGWPCPGCGLTRATLALLVMDFPRAFAMHPLVIPAWVDVLLVAVLMVTGKRQKATIVLLSLSLMGFLGVYVWRMTTLYPTVQPMVPFKYALVTLIKLLF